MINKAIVSLLPLVPKSLVWKISKRYIAGTTLKDALECVGNLNDQGMSATLDVLGEDSTTREQALSGEALYQEALVEIDRQSLDANISVKLSMLALRFDEALCIEILQKLIRTAELHDSFVRIDMEDSSVTQKTLDIYRQLRKETDRVGTVVQGRRLPSQLALPNPQDRHRPIHAFLHLRMSFVPMALRQRWTHSSRASGSATSRASSCALRAKRSSDRRAAPTTRASRRPRRLSR